MEDKDLTYSDVQLIVDDLKKVRDSLRREISTSQYEASRLRDEVKAFIEESAKHKNIMKELEVKVLNKRSELASIDDLIDKERKIVEEGKNEMDILRQNFTNEQAVWNQEKSGAMSVIEARTKELNRLQVDTLNRKADVDEMEKQVNVQLEEISSRRIKIQEAEIKVQQKDEESSRTLEAANLSRVSSEKILEEAKAEKKMYQDLKVKINSERNSLAEREQAVKDGYQENERNKEEMRERSREILISESKLRDLKLRTTKEIEAAKVESEQKKRLLGEVQEIKTIA